MIRPYLSELAHPAEPNGSKPVAPATADDSNIEGVYVFPASLEQSRYWILDQLEGASTASNMAIAFRLEGEVRDELVRQSLEELTLRHEALRTSFQMIDGVLCQVIWEEPEFSLTITDLKQIPEEERERTAEELILQHSHVRVDLASAPALFVHLIHVSGKRHYMAFTMHHISCDGWSNGLLIRDFSELYSAAAEGRPSTLPELPFQFADFTVWQQSWIESAAAEDALAYWKEHIQRDMPAVDLPTDSPRQAGKSFPGHIESELMSESLQARLKAYCRKHDATLHQVLLAGFEALIARYANQTEFLLGSTIANRTQPGMENVVGRFANPQIILADVRNNPTYRELLRRVIDWSAAAYAHQDLPFSRLTEAFQLDQAGATSQFLQVYFVYQKAFMQPQEAGGLKVIPRPSVSGGVNFDLLVSIVERAEGPRLQIEYNTTLFRKERIRHFITLYLRVLDAVMTNDALTVSMLPLVSTEELSLLKTANSGTAVEARSKTSLVAWFDDLVTRAPEAVAVQSADRAISRADLKTRSLHMAEAFRQKGVTAGQVVGLRMESGTDTATAALALLRLGSTILPVSEGASADSWQRMMASLNPAFCFAGHDFAQKVSGITAIDELKNGEATAPSGIAYPASADVAWTGILRDAGGSLEATGTSHGHALGSLLRAAAALGIDSEDAILSMPAITSHDAWTDLMLPLMAGATLVYPGATDGQPLQSVCDRHQVTYAFGDVQEWSAMLSEGWQGDRRLNIVCRGSRMSASFVGQLTGLRGKAWSLASSASTGGPFSAVLLSRATVHPWPIRPLPGETFLIQDEWGNPAPFGVPGELVVRQNAVERRPGFQARFSPQDGFEIVERAGGSARLHSYRLSLGQLQDLLLQHPSVASAEAAIVPNPANEPVLTAFVVFRRDQTVSTATLSAWLKSNGPGHLASAEVVAVNAIPRRLDGSADLEALPRPGETPATLTEMTEYAPARDKLEGDLVAIWEEVLGVLGIGIRTSFFTLGGYSLMMVRLFARINRALSVALPITTIFNAPTIEKLADIIRGRTLYSPLVPVKTSGTKAPFFLIHSYLLYGSLPSALGADYPFYGLRELDGRDQHVTIEARVASYADEIRSVQPHGPYYIGGWCAAGPLAVETARQFIEAGEKVAIVVLFDSWRPGYAQELATKQSGSPDMSLRAVLGRKWRFHSNRLRPLSGAGRTKYVWDAARHKIVSLRDRAYLKHWAFAQRLFSKFGLPLPHFMHNISLRTLNLVKEYKPDSFPVRITLIRATDAIYIPGASPACGWESAADLGVDVLWAPGDHETMFVEPNLKVVGEILRTCIDKANAEEALHPVGETTLG